jgi:GNAT superfamily N-acetyltransferase
MDDATLFARQLATLHAFYSVVVSGRNDSRLIHHQGLTAAVVPATPARSIFNGVVYDDEQALADALPELAETYEAAGVRAWMVWSPRERSATRERLQRSGHVLDANPAAMALELGSFERRPSNSIDLDPEPDMADVARINDAAYGYSDEAFVRAIGSVPAASVHAYVARVDGAPAASTVTFDHGDDCYVGFVATLPPARGSGLATELMSHAVFDARERGCATATLQATTMGQPIYARLGFRDLGPIEMWERRRSE